MEYGWNFYFAQMLSVIALYFFATSWHKKNHKKILTNQIFSGMFNITGLLFLNAYSGAILSSITLSRNLLFMQKERIPWVQSKKVILFFMIILVLAAISTWRGYITILPAIGSLFGTYSISRDDPQTMHKYMLVGVSLWIPYNIYVQAYMASIGTIIMVLNIFWTIIKNNKENYKNKRKVI